MAKIKRLTIIFIGIFLTLVLSASVCPPGSPDAGESLSPDWLLNCSHCVSTPTPPISVPTPFGTPEPSITFVGARQCTEQEITDGCFETQYPIGAYKCYCWDEQIESTPIGGGTPPPAITPTIQTLPSLYWTDNYYSEHIKTGVTGSHITLNKVLQDININGGTVIGFVAEMSSDVPNLNNWNTVNENQFGWGLWHGNNPYVEDYRYNKRIEYGYVKYCDVYIHQNYISQVQSSLPMTVNSCSTATARDGTWQDSDPTKMGVVYAWHMNVYGKVYVNVKLLINGIPLNTPTPIPQPTSTLTNNEQYCSVYDYANTDPVATAPNITIQNGSCFTVLPAFSLDIPAVGNMSAFTISWESFKLCPVWIDITAMQLFDITIPMELLIVPFLMFLITMVMRL